MNKGSFVGLLVADLFGYEYDRNTQSYNTVFKSYNMRPENTYAVVFGAFDHEKRVPALLERPEINVLFSSGPCWNNHNVHINYDKSPNLWLVVFELKSDGKVPQV